MVKKVPGKPGKVEGATAAENRNNKAPKVATKKAGPLKTKSPVGKRPATPRVEVTPDTGMRTGGSGLSGMDMPALTSFDAAPDYIRNWANNIQNGMTGSSGPTVINMDDPNY